MILGLFLMILPAGCVGARRATPEPAPSPAVTLPAISVPRLAQVIDLGHVRLSVFHS